jgi:hypothetical protein
MDWEEGWGKGEKQEGRLKWCRLCGDANLYELDMLLIGNQQRGTDLLIAPRRKRDLNRILLNPALVVPFPFFMSLKVTSSGPHVCESIAHGGISSKN